MKGPPRRGGAARRLAARSGAPYTTAPCLAVRAAAAATAASSEGVGEAPRVRHPGGRERGGQLPQGPRQHPQRRGGAAEVHFHQERAEAEPPPPELPRHRREEGVCGVAPCADLDRPVPAAHRVECAQPNHKGAARQGQQLSGSTSGSTTTSTSSSSSSTPLQRTESLRRRRRESPVSAAIPNTPANSVPRMFIGPHISSKFVLKSSFARTRSVGLRSPCWCWNLLVRVIGDGGR